MENGASGGGVNGFSVLDKEVAPGGDDAANGNVVGSYGLGEVMHTTESFRSENIMMGRHIRHDGLDGGHGGTGGDVGPTCGANKKNIYMYGDDVPVSTAPHTSSIPPFTVGGGGAGGAVLVRISQPFHCSNNSPLPFNSPGMATALGFPFTCAQWKELERQAMVFKYMMASVPVPPDLLLPIPTDAYTAGHNTAVPHFHSQSVNSGCVHGLGFSSKNRDLEPGRCKRTDGKKWRCSKEVAPNQKYCERHLHRGRPRSRKPVEDHTLHTNTSNSKKSSLRPAPLQSASMVISQPTATGPSSQLLGSSDKHNAGPQSLDAKMEHKFSISPLKEPHRSFNWVMEGEIAMGGAEEQWQQLMETNTRLAFGSSSYRDYAPIFQSMNLFGWKDLDGNQDGIRHNGECNLYLNPELGTLDKEFLAETPRGFIDAWSNGNITNIGSCVSPSVEGNMSPSSLSLSVAMAAGNILDSEMGIPDSDVANCHNDHNKCSNSTWRAPVSWVPFASGGPLAEVLKPSQHHYSSSYISNGDSISPAGTTVSSPSGVLQKTTLFSQSDGSVCNSPTLAAAELVPFQ